jgi:hypothetical protein
LGPGKKKNHKNPYFVIDIAHTTPFHEKPAFVQQYFALYPVIQVVLLMHIEFTAPSGTGKMVLYYYDRAYEDGSRPSHAISFGEVHGRSS